MNSHIKVSKEHFLFIALHLIIFVLLLLFAYITYNDETILKCWSEVIVNVMIILLLIHTISFWIKKVGICDFRFWFIYLSYLFMFGRVILNALQLDTGIFWDLLSRHSRWDLFHSSLYILCALQGMFIGFFIKPNTNFSEKYFEDNKKKNDLYVIGVIMCLLSLPFKLYVDLQMVISAQNSSSYKALVGTSGLADDISFLFIPGVIYIISSGKVRKNKVSIILVLTFLYLIAVMILTGDRRYSVTAILALVLCCFKVFDFKLNVKKIVLNGYLVIVALNLLMVIRKIRAYELVSFFEFISNHWEEIFIGTDFITETLAEFGITYFSVVNIFKVIPTIIPFQKGIPYIIAIPSVLPIGWLVGEWFDKASISGQVNDIVGTSVGSSFIGDLYGNFAWLGAFMAIVSGWLIMKVMDYQKANSRFYIARYYSVFYVLINLVRANFFEIIRPVIMILVIPVLISWLKINKRE